MSDLDLDPSACNPSHVNRGVLPGCGPGVSGGKAPISLKLTAETSKQTALMKKATTKRPPRPRPPVTPPDPPPSMESGLDSEMLHRSPSPQRSYSGHSQRSSRSPSPPHRRRYSGARDDTGRGRSRSPNSRSSRRSVGHRTRSRTPPGGGGGGREGGGRSGSRRDPRDKSQLVAWTNPVVILGEKVRNAVFHFCDECDRPILIYGRMIPCKHVFCLPCSTRAQQDAKQSCPRCGDKINRLEKCTIGSIYMCHYGGTQNGYTGCRRTYLSQRDLQAHVDTRHTKSASAVPQRPLPPVSQQVAAIAAVAAAVGPPAVAPNAAIRPPPPPLGSVPNPSLPPNAVRAPITASGFVNPPPVLASTAFPPPMRPPPSGPAAVAAAVAGAANAAAAAASFNAPPGGMAPRPPQGAIFSSAPPGLVTSPPGLQTSGGNGQPNWQARPPRPPF